VKATLRLAHESTQLFMAAWQHFMLVKTDITALKVRSHCLEFKMLMVAVLRWNSSRSFKRKVCSCGVIFHTRTHTHTHTVLW